MMDEREKEKNEIKEIVETMIELKKNNYKKFLILKEFLKGLACK